MGVSCAGGCLLRSRVTWVTPAVPLLPMHKRLLTPLLFAIIALAGCHASPYMASYIENHNAQLRQLEDEYWRQVQENERLAFELEKERRMREGLPPRRRVVGPRGSTEESDGTLQPPVVEEGITTPPKAEPHPAPRIDAEPPPEMPQSLPPAGAPRESGRPDRDEGDSAGPADPQGEVSHLFLNPLHTGGADFDNRPGDDGIRLCLEPRNSRDEFVPLAGPVSVVLLDPTQAGEAARVARWDFSAAETSQALAKGEAIRGIRLEMPWPSRPPASDQLRLFVRYQTPDGRKLQMERDLFIRLPGQFSERWTPRPPERSRRNVLAEPAIAAGPSAAAPGIGRPIREPAVHTSPEAQGAGLLSKAAAPSPMIPPASLSEAPAAAPLKPKWKPYR